MREGHCAWFPASDSEQKHCVRPSARVCCAHKVGDPSHCPFCPLAECGELLRSQKRDGTLFPPFPFCTRWVFLCHNHVFLVVKKSPLILFGKKTAWMGAVSWSEGEKSCWEEPRCGWEARLWEARNVQLCSQEGRRVAWVLEEWFLLLPIQLGKFSGNWTSVSQAPSVPSLA